MLLGISCSPVVSFVVVPLCYWWGCWVAVGQFVVLVVEPQWFGEVDPFVVGSKRAMPKLFAFARIGFEEPLWRPECLVLQRWLEFVAVLRIEKSARSLMAVVGQNSFCNCACI